ncbi:MAG: FxsA family protein [Hyphomicrobiales bacterium]|nr:FxsA family protein [Hyphomicrobiales bacterium]
MTEQANDRARGGLRMGWLVALWVVLEIAAFSWVAGRIGLFGALALTLGASMLGLYRLKVVGLAAATALRGSFAGGAPRPGGLLDGTLEALGAVLLILPGFLSDLVGLALLAPSARTWVAKRFSAEGAATPLRRGPAAIDLDAEEWRRIEPKRRRAK